MQLEMVSGLLLPLGVWLIVSASTRAQFHRRLSASALLSLAIGFLCYAAFGFALSQAADGSALALTTYSGQRWYIAGTQGFLLQGIQHTASLNQFIGSLPIVLSGGLLVAALLAHHTRVAWQAAVTVLVTGVLLPLAACWLWGGGWIQTLGNSAGVLGGAVDLGHLSTLGLVVGAASLAWLAKAPRREGATDDMPDMPVAELPIRAVAGVLCVLIASATYASTNNAVVPLMQFVNTSVVVSIAILTAGMYAIFATRKPDTLSAARAALASVFAASAGGAALPFWALLACGVVCGLLATMGYYTVNEKLRWVDDNAIISSVLIPSVLGMLMTGVAAGDTSAISLLALQLVALVTIGGISYGLTTGLVMAAHRTSTPLDVTRDVLVTQATSVPPSSTLEVSAIDAPAHAAIAQALETNISPADGELVPMDAAKIMAASPNTNLAQPVTRQSKLLGWLRRKTEDAAPQTPRKVAYPYRLGGRRMVSRPLTQSSGDGSEAAES
jgi:Amt family ammonium transporter